VHTEGKLNVIIKTRVAVPCNSHINVVIDITKAFVRVAETKYIRLAKCIPSEGIFLHTSRQSEGKASHAPLCEPHVLTP